MLAWACLACALFLGASGVAIAALYDRMDTRELAPPARCWPPAWR